ncbi:AraC family transcriptional regulator [Streptomyces zaomyceticus]|uniref:AraC family transcriptional regulator n=1 Tax=Streptomyces zaomyceticus TaxID=68286 RepID=UPI0036ABA38B
MDVVSDAISAVRIGQPSSRRVRVAGSWCTRLAPYEGAGFHVVLEGSCWLLPDGGEPVGLGPGDAVLLPHGTGHVLADGPVDAAGLARAVPFERWEDGTGPRPPVVPTGSVVPEDGTAVEMLCGKYRLDRSHAHPLLAELPPLVHLPYRADGSGGTGPGLRSAIALLGHEVGERLPGAAVALPSLLDLLLVYMIRSWTAGNGARGSRAGTAGTWPAALGDPVTAAALRALHTDPAAPWTNDLLAAEAGVSRPTLARRFTALVGRPPMAYLTWWRLTRAAALLRDTHDPLASVARRVGYSTPYALSHAFRREFGTTPGQYRADRAAAAAGRPGVRAAMSARAPAAPRTGSGDGPIPGLRTPPRARGGRP